MKSIPLKLCSSVVICFNAIGLCDTVFAGGSAQPSGVTIVEPQAAQMVVPQRYVYDQKVNESTTIFSESKSRQFVSEFGALFAGKGKPNSTFAIRVNPTPDGNRIIPNNFDDQQATADIVRYFGRPLREGGMILVDETSGPNSKVDFVLNVLISWRTISMTGFSGESKTKVVPEVQVTAVRCADGAIVGQAGTADLIGSRQNSWVLVERVGIPELMRATALVLLEDMITRKFSEELAAISQSRSVFISQLPADSKPAEITPSPTDSNKESTSPAKQPILPIETNHVQGLDDGKKQEAARINNNIASLNKESEEIELWKIALVGDDQTKKHQTDSNEQLVKNVVKQTYQTQ